MINDTQSRTITQLLKSLQALAFPHCESVADELAYVACRDKIIGDALDCIGATASNADPLRYISVDEQALAQLVLSKTFDSHKDLLRQQLQQAQLETQRWKQIALSANPRASAAFVDLTDLKGVSHASTSTATSVDVATQTDEKTGLADQNGDAAVVVNMLGWSQRHFDQLLESTEAKLQALEEALVANFSVSRSSFGQVDDSAEQVSKAACAGPKARASVPGAARRAIHKKGANTSLSLFERLSAPNAPTATQAKPPCDTTAQNNESHVLYEIRAMPLQVAHRSGGRGSKLPQLAKK